jgi:Fe-S cluster assembly protein SufD
MPYIADEKEVFLDHLSRLDKQLAGGVFDDLRQSALAAFEELSFPGSRTEDWKFTSIAPILETPFELAATVAAATELRGRLAAVELPGAIRLVFLNGIFAPELSRVDHLPAGVVAGSLAATAGYKPALAEHLGRVAEFQDHIFTALNTASLRDGALVLIPRGTILETPIEVLHVHVAENKTKPSACYPRSLIVAGTGSQAKIVERYFAAGRTSGTYFTNAVTEIVVEEGAVLEHCKLQQESTQALHLANTEVRQARGSNFSSRYISFGGRWVRNEVRVRFEAEGSEASLDGLYLAGGSQHIDNLTVIDHAMPHCVSHELYRGILNDRAHGVFNGKIFVRPGAQKTDAKQTNQVLLLSEDAVINTKPQLEIFADDVKCTHGATVGQLDAESLFYLRSRGIGLDDARRLLTFAFANDVVSRIGLEAVRREIEHLLMTHALPGSNPEAS